MLCKKASRSVTEINQIRYYLNEIELNMLIRLKNISKVLTKANVQSSFGGCGRKSEDRRIGLKSTLYS